MSKKSKLSSTVQKPRRSAVSSIVLGRESDGTYLLKLVVFVLLGSLWLKFVQPMNWNGIQIVGLPIGLLIGLLLVHQFEKRQSDRKIWYACLIIVTILSLFAPIGIFL